MESTNKQLDSLFEYWKAKSKALKDADEIVTDGIMRKFVTTNTINNTPWKDRNLRIAFLVKDNPDGAHDTRNWLEKEDNRNLKSVFLHKIANLFYGLSHSTNDDGEQWWFGEIEQHAEDVKTFFNTEPFAFVECKKQSGTTKIDDKKLETYIKKYKNLLNEEIEILNPNIIVCMGQPIFDFVLKMYSATEENLVAEQNIHYIPSCKKIIIYAAHPSARDSYQNHYEGVMYWYRQFLHSNAYKEFINI